ncbi:hypothetical protein ABMC89_06055 [Sulfitobacter sp. HNIBRBA3233]|uniref:hypothetical protein n=1 Tax=Sulfitobacter marinivivus TaxID=3158558 RepID=UPI0032DEEE42
MKLMRHAIALLTHNPFQTIRVVAPGLALMIGVIAITVVFAPDLLTYSTANPKVDTLRWSGLPLVLVASFILSYALMAVLWHRYTLSASRKPHPLGPMLILGYLWRVTLLAAIQLGASLALILPLTFAQQNGGGVIGGPALPSILLTTFLTQLILLWFSLRLSLILPAAALGRPITLLQSWRLTQTMTRALWGVSTLLALLNTVLTATINSLAPPTAGRTLVIELPIYVLEGLLIFSVLTTLYAQLIQKKRLIAI